ncbi:MAG: hypothetical protein HYU88_10840 [Chloroflexi bacterium]|nr:hypothetical protein [Chloroflexota bacterium]MBI4507979.1 hypothetical protein [Chloroflexota bacterium]
MQTPMSSQPSSAVPPPATDRPLELALSAVERAFLRAAIAHYCAACCPLLSGQDWCPLLTWRESVHSGAIERVCLVPFAAWLERLAEPAGPALVASAP